MGKNPVLPTIRRTAALGTSAPATLDIGVQGVEARPTSVVNVPRTRSLSAKTVYAMLLCVQRVDAVIRLMTLACV